jgi:putative mycofactocin binding protein MftB
VSTNKPDSEAELDLDSGWKLHPQVSIRPERFGALLYHFGTRKLCFVTTALLLQVVELLDSSRSARAACVEAGVAAEEMSSYVKALSTLAASSMICERQAAA